MRYKIIRFYSPMDGRPNRTIKIVDSLKEAHKHTRNPKTRKEGVYFDGYSAMKDFKPYKVKVKL